MIATQFFYTLNFLAVLISLILVLLFFLCGGPDQKHFVHLITAIGIALLIGGACGGLAVIVFASLGNSREWMPGHANNYLGWSFGLAVVGVVACFVSGSLFLAERHIQHKKRKYMKESQTRFELESDVKS